MKLNINAKELLALYNVLYERYEIQHPFEKEYIEGDPRATTDEQLRQIYNRVKSIVVASLGNKMVDPLDSWLEGQRRKLGQHDVETSAKLKGPGDQVVEDNRETIPVIMSAEDTDMLPDNYPRKGPAPSSRKFRGNKR